MESIANPYEELAGRLEALVALSDGLCELLLTERQALTDRDPSSLQTILDAKRAKCGEIEEMTLALGATPLSQQIQDAPGALRKELEHLHTSLLEQADRAQEYNAVNGKIVRRSQQSVRDLIHLISGMDAELLYGDQGQTMATAQGTAIAKA